MDIGIITLWKSSDNYGQVLQMCALQAALKKLGHNPRTIRYHYDLYKSSVKEKIRKFFLIYPILLILIRYKQKKKLNKIKKEILSKNVQREFDKFKSDYIQFYNNDYYTLHELQIDPPLCDVLIVGSDQVWGYLLNNKENETFFLNFGGKRIKRISYAASFGRACYPSKLKSKLKSNLNRIDFISVREESSQKICQSVGIKSQHVLDPTLLFPSGFYSDLFSDTPPRCRNASFVFVYYLNVQNKNDLPWQELCSFAVNKKLSVIFTTSSGYCPGQEFYNFGEYDYPTIEGWIYNIRAAEYVITTSFHGVVFSILFHKKFLFIPLQPPFDSSNVRVVELLQTLNMSHCIYNKEKNLEDIFMVDVDWSTIDSIINNKRNVSYAFLKESISI